MSCASSPPIVLPVYKIGTTWHGLTNYTISSDSAQWTLAHVVCHFKILEASALTISSDGASPGIVITSAASRVFDIVDRILDLGTGYYSLEIFTTDETGFVRAMPIIYQQII